MKELNKTATTIEEKLKKENVIKFAYTISDNKKEEFTAQNGEFSLLRTVFSSIFSLTVFLDERVGTKVGNDLTEEGIEKTIKEAIDAAMQSFSAVNPLGDSERVSIERMIGKLPTISFFVTFTYCFLYGTIVSKIFASGIPPEDIFSDTAE